MIRRKNNKVRVETVPLPSELWLVIFDIVIEEGIIWLIAVCVWVWPNNLFYHGG